VQQQLNVLEQQIMAKVTATARCMLEAAKAMLQATQQVRWSPAQRRSVIDSTGA
jgi:hypothetical protein